MIGALLFVGIYCMLFPARAVSPPVPLYHAAQIVMAIIIGSSFSSMSLLNISSLALAIVVFTVLNFVVGVLLAWIFSRLFHWSFLTVLFGVIPGGMTVLLILADEFDLNVGVIAAFQTLRLLTAVLILPVIFSFML